MTDPDWEQILHTWHADAAERSLMIAERTARALTERSCMSVNVVAIITEQQDTNEPGANG
jgi:hypothetical protein